MTVAAPQASSLISLHRAVMEMPQNIANKYIQQASLYNLASKVCLVAFLAIVGLGIAMYVGICSFLPPAALLPMVLGTFPLQYGFQKLWMYSVDYRLLAKEELGKVVEFTKIQHWKQPEIQSFLKEHKLSLDPLSLQLLNQIDPKEPYRALLPAIARYNYWDMMAKQHLKHHLENLHNTHEDPSVRLQGRIIGWDILEKQALPAALQAAFILQIIAQPNVQIQLNDLGTYRMKSFHERSFDWMLDRTDDFFVFKDPSHASLGLQELETLLAASNLDALRLKLFPKEKTRPVPRQ